MANESEILRVFNFCWLGKEKPPGILLKWGEVLKPYPFSALMEAAKLEAAENEWPNLSRIIELVDEILPRSKDDSLTGDEAFHLVRLAVRKYGLQEFSFSESQKLEGKKKANTMFVSFPMLRAYLALTGLYEDLCNAIGDYQRETLRKRFIVGWESFKKRQRTEAKLELIRGKKHSLIQSNNKKVLESGCELKNNNSTTLL